MQMEGTHTPISYLIFNKKQERDEDNECSQWRLVPAPVTSPLRSSVGVIRYSRMWSTEWRDRERWTGRQCSSCRKTISGHRTRQIVWDETSIYYETCIRGEAERSGHAYATTTGRADNGRPTYCWEKNPHELSESIRFEIVTTVGVTSRAPMYLKNRIETPVVWKQFLTTRAWERRRLESVVGEARNIWKLFSSQNKIVFLTKLSPCLTDIASVYMTQTISKARKLWAVTNHTIADWW
jgi:hypothetical protein